MDLSFKRVAKGDLRQTNRRMKTAARNGKNTAEEERKRKKGRGGKDEKERTRRKGTGEKDEKERKRRKGR